MIERAQQNPTEHLVRFIHEILTALKAMVQTVCLGAILIFIEPWVIVVLAPSALPYPFVHWRLSRPYYLDEYYRTPKRRWTSYFVSLLTSRNSITDIKLLGLALFLISRLRSLMTQFRDEGAITFDRTDLREIDMKSFHGQIAFVLQDSPGTKPPPWTTSRTATGKTSSAIEIAFWRSPNLPACTT